MSEYEITTLEHFYIPRIIILYQERDRGREERERERERDGLSCVRCKDSTNSDTSVIEVTRLMNVKINSFVRTGVRQMC